MEQEFVFRVVIVGDANVGKSSLLLRFSENTFKEQYRVTIGVEFGIKLLRVDRQLVKLQIWDTAGQESFRSIARNFYRKADGVLLVYDFSARDTFENCEYWLGEIKRNAPVGAVIYLIGNKVDLLEDNEGQRQVTAKEAMELVGKYGLGGFLETSARTGFQVDDGFYSFIRQLIVSSNDRKACESIAQTQLGLVRGKRKKSKCC